MISIVNKFLKACWEFCLGLGAEGEQSLSVSTLYQLCSWCFDRPNITSAKCSPTQFKSNQIGKKKSWIWMFLSVHCKKHSKTTDNGSNS